MRFREDSLADLARARAAVAAWREQNPTGTGEELVAAVRHQSIRSMASCSVLCCSRSTGAERARLPA